MEETKRVFLGIDLSIDLKHEIEQLKLSEDLAKLPLKLVEQQNSHIAVKFLNTLNARQINQVKEVIVNQTKDLRIFKVKILNSLIFPNSYRPRVLALKVVSQGLETFGQKLISSLEKLDFVVKESRKYIPHITLGRINGMLSEKEINNLIKIKFSAEEIIDHLTLFESQLTSEGPIYSIVKNFTFHES